MKIEPLKITIELATPVVTESEYPIYLDALLSYAASKEAEAAGLADAWKAGEDLPLGRAGQGDDWVYQASMLIFTPIAPRELVNMQRKASPEMFYRDFELGLWGFPALKSGKENTKEPPTINTLSGQFRAYQYYTSTQWMSHACAYCIGDKEAITRLLKQLTHIGKMGRNGWGLIDSITVESDPCAESKWALRVLPAGIQSPLSDVEYMPVLSAPRAPYWNKQTHIEMQGPAV